MGVTPLKKVAVSVSEMATMVGLSRARFYELVKAGVFPPPERQPHTARPYYTEDQQEIVLEVRRRNRGVNGEPVVFNARRRPTLPPQSDSRKAKPAAASGPHAGLLASLQALGLAGVTAAQVAAAVAEIYPKGVATPDAGEVVRAVFLHLQVSAK